MNIILIKRVGENIFYFLITINGLLVLLSTMNLNSPKLTLILNGVGLVVTGLIAALKVWFPDITTTKSIVPPNATMGSSK